MSVLFLVLPITLLISAAALAAYAWATRSGQLDDLETPALRVLHDEAEPSVSALGGAVPLSSKNPTLSTRIER
ncbi:MAG TPA: cbb3-type cytochrome oxidase assembly protein CcoS [Polyangiaceae bacterium]|jgi:cbb3-type cytochrome oxidase maturation protein|nr:cbb3-type cytochrome oxidase assembly protein CcoS [Polyangiaceae bacterium]